MNGKTIDAFKAITELEDYSTRLSAIDAPLTAALEEAAGTNAEFLILASCIVLWDLKKEIDATCNKIADAAGFKIA